MKTKKDIEELIFEEFRKNKYRAGHFIMVQSLNFNV